jgi:hypothetical protein
MIDNKLNVWFEGLKNIWLNKTPNEVESLVADKFIWYENPFQPPITSKEELLKEWQSIHNHKQLSIDYKVISFQNNVGIATAESTFTLIDTKVRVEMKGIWFVILDKEGKCTEFRQWFNMKETKQS